MFAIRSSSPEEDLVGISLAGGYEIVLGVNRRNTILEDSIKGLNLTIILKDGYLYEGNESTG